MVDHDLRRALHTLVELREDVERQATDTLGRWRPWIIRDEFLPSARNLAAYLALRRRDLRPLQAALMPWGLSSLGRLESRVEPTLAAVTATVTLLVGVGEAPPRPSGESFFEGEQRLRRNTDQVFGREHKHRRVRIMVTLPAEAAGDHGLTRDLLLAGTDCFRINCAHDDLDTWERMVGNIHAGEAETGRSAVIGMDLAGQKPRTMEVLLPDPPRRLRAGDRILLTPDVPVPSDAVEFQARCSLPAVLDQLVPGCTVALDDGRVLTELESLGPSGAVLRVVATRPKGDNLRPARGLNFPGTRLDLPVLTEKDLADLDFVAAHADVVGFSFVQTPDDVALLQHELARRLHGRPLPPLMAKIETAHAVRNLPELIVRAAGRQPFAVMIARGDLAVEIGYRRLAEIQEEILWVCEAAHVPVVWATEVLERLTKSGTPTRAEVTDAAMAERAECVMLNKGPYAVPAVTMLDDVLTRMQGHASKKTPQLRALRSWRHLVTAVPVTDAT